MTTALTLDGSPVISEHKKRVMRRRKADIDVHEAKREHRLTINALRAAIMALESGDRSAETLAILKQVAIRAEAFTQ